MSTQTQEQTADPSVHKSTDPLIQPSTESAANPYACVLATPPPAALPAARVRNGKIARLPKLERDLVNKLLHNNIAYSKIVWALSERGITVTERNISNWRTRGGYSEWSAQQDNQLRLAHLQDHLTDYLRKHDAQQLPEVGLQVASTQLTSLLMNPQTAAPLLADPDKYARIVQALDKCSVRLNELQKERYDTAKRANIRGTIPYIQHEEAHDVESLRLIASAKKLATSTREDDIPHRNELPPREEMPHTPAGPSFAETMQLQAKLLAERLKQLPDAPAEAA